MSQMYAFLKPISVNEQFENALMSSDVESLVKYSAPLVQAFEEIKDWAINIGGACLSSFGTEICIRIPITKVSGLGDFMKKFEYTTKLDFGVGVGTNPLEAFKAMQTSVSGMGERIVFWSPDLDEERVEDQLEKNFSDNKSYDLDLPNFDLEKDDATPEQKQEQEKPQPTTKQKVMEALMMVKQNAASIAQLKQVDPKAYDAVKKLVDAMVRLAQHGA